MDNHRKEYKEIREELIRYIDGQNPDYLPKGGKKAIHRINNNLVYNTDLHF